MTLDVSINWFLLGVVFIAAVLHCAASLVEVKDNQQRKEKRIQEQIDIFTKLDEEQYMEEFIELCKKHISDYYEEQYCCDCPRLYTKYSTSHLDDYNACLAPWSDDLIFICSYNRESKEFIGDVYRWVGEESNN